MKNILIPLSECPESPGHYQPSLVPHGHQYESLESAMSYRKGPYKIRSDLDGLVRECGGLQIIELPYPEEIVAVKHQDPSAARLAIKDEET